jgi:hypothetical protein
VRSTLTVDRPAADDDHNRQTVSSSTSVRSKLLDSVSEYEAPLTLLETAL